MHSLSASKPNLSFGVLSWGTTDKIQLFPQNYGSYKVVVV